MPMSTTSSHDRHGMTGHITSHLQISTAVATTNDPARRPWKKALLIGSNYIYMARDKQASRTSVSSKNSVSPTDQVDGSLDSPCKDVYRWKSLLLKSFHFTEEHIHVLVDEETHTCDVNDAIGTAHQHDPRMRPKRANIKRELRELVKDAIPGDQLLFFFAGHVGQVDCEEDTEDDGLDEAIVPADALGSRCNWLKDNELKKILVNELPPGVQLVCIIDACHSATLFDLPHSHCNTNISLTKRTYVNGFVSLVHRASLQDVSRRTSSHLQRSGTVTEAGTASSHGWAIAKKESTSTTISCERSMWRASNSSAAGHGASLNSEAEEDFAQRFFLCPQMSAEPETICESPTQDAPQQVPDETCGGGCRVDPDFKGPLVVTISACQDDQEAWENKRDGGSLTKVLVPFLEENANRTYRELMERLRDALDGIVHREHEKFRSRSPEQARRGFYHGPAYQDPQLCSSTPLDMNQLLFLSRPV